MDAEDFFDNKKLMKEINPTPEELKLLDLEAYKLDMEMSMGKNSGDFSTIKITDYEPEDEDLEEDPTMIGEYEYGNQDENGSVTYTGEVIYNRKTKEFYYN